MARSIGSIYEKMQRVALIAQIIGRKVGLSEDELEDLKRASEIYKFDFKEKDPEFKVENLTKTEEIKMQTFTKKIITVQAKEQEKIKGENISVIIRPENVQISIKPFQSQENTFKGRIKAKIFLGNTLRLLIGLEEKKELEADLHVKEMIQCKEGDEIYVYLPKEELVVVEK